VIQEPTLSNFKPPEQVAAPVALLLLVSCTGLGVWWVVGGERLQQELKNKRQELLAGRENSSGEPQLDTGEKREERRAMVLFITQKSCCAIAVASTRGCSSRPLAILVSQGEMVTTQTTPIQASNNELQRGGVVWGRVVRWNGNFQCGERVEGPHHSHNILFAPNIGYSLRSQHGLQFFFSFSFFRCLQDRSKQ
jgi:hypothetical protein